MDVRCLQERQFLTDEQLQAMPTDKLFHHFKMARAAESFILNWAGRRCCEICMEYIGNDWENEVAKPARVFSIYMKRVKAILDKRPDQFSHRKLNKGVNNRPTCVKRRRKLVG